MRNKIFNMLLTLSGVIYCVVLFNMYNGFQNRLSVLLELNHNLAILTRNAVAQITTSPEETVLSDEIMGFLPTHDSNAVNSAFDYIVNAVDGEMALTQAEAEIIDDYTMAVPIQLEFTGSFNDALKVVGLLETGGQLVRIGKVGVARSADSIATQGVKLSANLQFIFSRTYIEGNAFEALNDVETATATLSVPKRKMGSEVLLRAIAPIKNPFQRDIDNLTLKSVIPWQETEFAAVLEMESGESFTLVPGESFNGIELESSAVDHATVRVLGQMRRLELSH